MYRIGNSIVHDGGCEFLRGGTCDCYEYQGDVGDALVGAFNALAIEACALAIGRVIWLALH